MIHKRARLGQVPFVLLAGLVGLVTGCPVDKATRCGDQVCPGGQSCDPVHELCVAPEQLEVCVGEPDGAACVVGGESGFVCDQEVCLPSECGDGILDIHTGEACDDGNSINDDGCHNDCTLGSCGDGVLNPGEECDDGDGVNSDTTPDACRTNCLNPWCGDGVLDSGEGCDDGNADDHDACLSTCVPAACGDGVVQSGVEQCDTADFGGQDCVSLGFASGSLTCEADCTFDRSTCVGGCGNGVVEDAEECDDGPANSDTVADACRTDCLSPWCGDGVVDATEECDDATANSDTTPDACRTNCLNPWCGDGVADATEECDNATANSDTAADACRTNCLNPWCGDGVVDATEDCEDGNSIDWDGCTACVISEFLINTHTASDQHAAAVAMTQDGSFVVAWQSYVQDGDNYGVYAQRFDATGTPAGGELQVNTHTANTQSYPAVAMASDGSFVVVWQSMYQDGNGFGVFGQRYDGTATAVGGEFQVNTHTPENQWAPAVAMAPDGRFVVTWHSWAQDGSDFGVYAQRYDATGTAAGGEFQVNSYTTGDQSYPRMTMASDGSFVVAWTSEDQDGSGNGVYARRYDATGTAMGGEFQVNTYTTGDQQYPAVAMAPDGRFVMAWSSYGQDGSNYGVFAQRYDATGTAAGGEFQVNTYTPSIQWSPAVALASDGSFVVAWMSNGQDGSYDGVYAQRYDATGTAVGGEFQVNVYTLDNQKTPAVAMSLDGRFVVAWESALQDGAGYGVYTQRYDNTGNALGVEP